MKLVLVEWIDAESIDEWTAIDDICNECALIKTVGYVIKENDELLTLAMNIDTKNGNASCIMNIPKGGMIKKITKLG